MNASCIEKLRLLRHKTEFSILHILLLAMDDRLCILIRLYLWNAELSHLEYDCVVFFSNFLLVLVKYEDRESNGLNLDDI